MRKIEDVQVCHGTSHIINEMFMNDTECFYIHFNQHYSQIYQIIRHQGDAKNIIQIEKR